MRDRRAVAEQGTRTGFTVAEVLVALVLLAVALLGLAGNAAVAVRATGAAVRERRAVQRGADRLASLRAQGCAAARGGTAADPALSLAERWSVSPATNGVVLIDEAVRWRAADAPRLLVLRSAILC